MFIVLEGCEGSGKTTQIELLKERWSPVKPVWYTKQPGGSLIGQRIRHLLLHEDEPLEPMAELLLFAADRFQHVQQIKQKLKENYIVVCDRYTASTVAYQGYGRELDLESIKAINAIACDNLKPDATILMTVDLREGLERAQQRKESNRVDHEPLSFHQKVYRAYNAMARDESWPVFNSSLLTAEEINDRLIMLLDTLLINGE